MPNTIHAPLPLDRIAPPADVDEPGAMAVRHKRELHAMHDAAIAKLEAEAARIQQELALLKGEHMTALSETISAVLAEDERTIRPYVRTLRAGEVPAIVAGALDAAARNCPADRAPVALLAVTRSLTVLQMQAGERGAGTVERIIACVDVEQARAAARFRKYGPGARD